MINREKYINQFITWRSKHNYPNRDQCINILKNIKSSKKSLIKNIRGFNIFFEMENWMNYIKNKDIREFFKGGSETYLIKLSDFALDNRSFIINDKKYILKKKNNTLLVYDNNKEIENNGKFFTNNILPLINDEIVELNKTIKQVENSNNNFYLANHKLSLEKQRLLDSNRIERNNYRKSNRLENYINIINDELTELIINKFDFVSKLTIKHNTNNAQNKTGIVQLSDLHFNEIVDLDFNQYNFTVASQRLKLLAERSKELFRCKGIKNILIALTGDLLNSNRRLDEVYEQVTNRTKASFLGSSLLYQFILDLNSDFNITVCSVSGNESRIEKEYGYSKKVLSDNFDFIIFNTVRLMFKNSDIMFINSDNPSETIVNVSGQNVLFTHGYDIGSKMEEKIQKIVGKYGLRGINIDYIFFGHLHSTRIADFCSRSASLIGANSYSDSGLGLASRASQNIAVFYDNGNKDVMKIDLQNTDHIIGYDIDSELEFYEAKAENKLGNIKTQNLIYNIK